MIFKKKKVILDTNFLLVPGELGIDIFSEIERLIQERHEIVVFENTLEELETLIDRDKSKHSFNAKLGFIMAKQKNLKTIKGFSGHVDDIILDYTKSKPENFIVATQDKDLKRRLKKNHVKTIGVRQKKYLILG